MEKPDLHLLVCASFRTNGAPQGVCHKKGSTDLLQYLNEELSDRGINAQVTTTGCLKVCDRGPAMIVYDLRSPAHTAASGQWYGPMNEEALDEVLDCLEQGKVADQYVLT